MKDTARLQLSELQNPPAIYRSAPFWSWNGEMEEQRVSDQLTSFYKVGMGGGFIHSRSGLKTPYMEEQWFACVQAAIDTAVREGGKVYLYDEDRYSSGFAGGEVCRRNPDFRQRHLTVATAPVPDGDTLAVFAVRRSDPTKVTAYRRLGEGEVAAEGEETWWFQVCDFVRNPNWHNHCDPIDICNAEAVDTFIALTHDRYAQECGAHFGDVIPALFTDEVCLAVLPSGKRTEDVIANHHWTRDYPRLFEERYGYDFVEYLPELFFAVDHPRQPTLARDYLTGLSDLFEENYSRRCGEWCARHRLAFTGHLHFADFVDFARVGNPLRQFRHWQWPGMDILTDRVAKLSAFKIAASAAHQHGDGRVVCEMYGCTGWDWPPERQRFHTGWQYCLGVNFRCQHLSHYTLAGWGKKDYPGSMTPHTPWFADYREIEDHSARLSYALTRGSYAARTLVLSPFTAVVDLFRGHHFDDSDPAADDLAALNTQWERINRTLIENHIDFDYGDESDLVSAEGRIAVGRMCYDRVIVLPGHSLSAATEATLTAAGIPVYRLTDDHIPSSLLEEFSADCRITVNGVNAAEVWSTRRVDGEQTILFVQSMADTEQTVDIALAAPSRVLLVEEPTGDLIHLPSATAHGKTAVTVTLPPYGNALLLFGYDAVGKALPAPLPIKRVALSAAPYDYTLDEPNTLPLDTVQIRLGDGEWSQPISISEAEDRIRRHYGLPPMLFYDTAQPWYLHRHRYQAFDEAWQMRCVFTVADIPAECRLAIEGYTTYDAVTLNGTAIPAPDGWLIDPDWQTAKIAPLLKTGENELLLTFRYDTDMELENFALAGDFGVTRIHPEAGWLADNLQVTALPSQIDGGAWADNGLPFYTGRLTYHVPVCGAGAPCVLDLSDAQALGYAVTLNGHREARLCSPFVFDLTDHLKPGENTLHIQLIPGRKNLLGPLHVENPDIADPYDFRFDNHRWQEEYALHTFRLK